MRRTGNDKVAALQTAAQQEGIGVSDATRGFVFNADLVAVIRFMDIGTKVAQTVRVLSYGSVLAEGTPDEIRRNPKVIEAYLGKSAAGAAA